MTFRFINENQKRFDEIIKQGITSDEDALFMESVMGKFANLDVDMHAKIDFSTRKMFDALSEVLTLGFSENQLEDFIINPANFSVGTLETKSILFSEKFLKASNETTQFMEQQKKLAYWFCSYLLNFQAGYYAPVFVVKALVKYVRYLDDVVKAKDERITALQKLLNEKPVEKVVLPVESKEASAVE